MGQVHGLAVAPHLDRPDAPEELIEKAAGNPVLPHHLGRGREGFPGGPRSLSIHPAGKRVPLPGRGGTPRGCDGVEGVCGGSRHASFPISGGSRARNGRAGSGPAIFHRETIQ